MSNYHSHSHSGGPGGPGGPGDDEDVPGPSERFLAAMALAETPEQQAAAKEIYRRLEEGAEVDDIKDLIERQMRIVVAQRNGRPVAAADDPGPGGPAGLVGGGGRRRDTRDNGPVGGLGARAEEDGRGW